MRSPEAQGIDFDGPVAHAVITHRIDETQGRGAGQHPILVVERCAPGKPQWIYARDRVARQVDRAAPDVAIWILRADLVTETVIAQGRDEPKGVLGEKNLSAPYSRSWR